MSSTSDRGHELCDRGCIGAAVESDHPSEPRVKSMRGKWRKNPEHIIKMVISVQRKQQIKHYLVTWGPSVPFFADQTCLFPASHTVSLS